MTNSIASGSAPQANPDQKIAKKELFPQTLYKMLKYTEEQGLNDVISWLPSNVGFFVHDEKKFMQKIFPIFFRGKQFSSFIRQLNLYGFKKISSGFEKGGFYHENFTRLNPSFARIRRLCGKSDAIRSSPERKLKVLNNVMPNAKGGFRHLPDRTNLPAEDPLKSLFKKAFRLDSQASNPCLEASDPEEKLVSAKDLMGIDPTHSILVGKKTVEGYKVINTKNIDGTDLSNYEVGGFVGKNVMIYNHAQVSGKAWISDYAKLFGYAQVFGHAWVYERAQVYDNAKIYGHTQVERDEHIYGDTELVVKW